MCNRLNCRFVHLMESDKVEVCDQRVAVCRDHANGQCKRKQCKYYHIPIVLPPANIMATLFKTQQSQFVCNNNNNNIINISSNTNNNNNSSSNIISSSLNSEANKSCISEITGNAISTNSDNYNCTDNDNYSSNSCDKDSNSNNSSVVSKLINTNSNGDNNIDANANNNCNSLCINKNSIISSTNICTKDNDNNNNNNRNTNVSNMMFLNSDSQKLLLNPKIPTTISHNLSNSMIPTTPAISALTGATATATTTLSNAHSATVPTAASISLLSTNVGLPSVTINYNPNFLNSSSSYSSSINALHHHQHHHQHNLHQNQHHAQMNTNFLSNPNGGNLIILNNSLVPSTPASLLQASTTIGHNPILNNIINNNGSNGGYSNSNVINANKNPLSGVGTISTPTAAQAAAAAAAQLTTIFPHHQNLNPLLVGAPPPQLRNLTAANFPKIVTTSI